MFSIRSQRAAAVAITAAGLLLGGCSTSSQGARDAAAGPAKECGSVRIAVNPWAGSAANAHVIGYLAQHRLGCQVSYVELPEEQNWAAMEALTVDIVPEVWGNEESMARYVEVRKTVIDAGPTGGDGTIGWFIPPWMAKAYPDITSWESLNKYAPIFQTPESKGKGQLLSNDPANVNNDNALIANLDLDYVIVGAASERAVVQAFREAERDRKPLLALFHAPQWIFTELELVRVALPAYDSKKAQCAPTVMVRCEYPQFALSKLMSKSFQDSGSPAALLTEDFSWTNKDQAIVSAGIDREGKSPQQAAQEWVDANPRKVSAFLARATM